MSQWLTDEVIELMKKVRKKGISYDWIQEAVQESLKLANKPVGTNYHLYIQSIEKKVNDRKNKKQFKQSELIGVEIEVHKDGQVHWFQYLDKKRK